MGEGSFLHGLSKTPQIGQWDNTGYSGRDVGESYSEILKEFVEL